MPNFSNLQLVQAHSAFFIAGINLHVFVFRKGEWNTFTTTLISGFTLGIALLAVALTQFAPGFFESNIAALGLAASLTASLIIGIYSSLLVYRAAFHRLNNFKGPFAARLSNLWITSKAVKKLQLHLEVQELHKQYGDIVRIGPTELSINNPKAIPAIHSARSPSRKGPWYSVLVNPMLALNVIRDKHEHTVRRKTWEKGFGSKALKDYEYRVANYANQLLSQIETHKGTPFNMTDWSNFFSFDVMGDLAFGKSFRMLENGIKHHFMTDLHKNMESVGMFSHMIWLFPLFKNTPIINAGQKRFWHFVKSQVDERIKNTPDRSDVFSWLLEDFNAIKNPSWQDRMNLYGDAYLIIIAGSDTTSATLTCLIFELAQHKEHAQRLREEIDDYFAHNENPEHLSLSKLQFLQACIDETLRLHPTVPSGLQRMTPPEGMEIDGTFIPGDTIVQVPNHTMFRDERIFPQPDEFIPERWTTRPELSRNPEAFVPFNTGKHSCVGKQLGLMELRYVASQIVSRYDIELAPGQTRKAFVEHQKDGFTLSLPPCQVVFKPRADKRGVA
ncbi:benzoate 4-monooxygenase cytochrome P450 [Colletotrichum higginsianum]|uniref:Benzoate 4-monooxygenase cytochrome P450 n=1 Tax=Colletotrichum higginsianum (strain IMI 349063) TaxID=759273 RepID=H1V237_COLHI|nr:Benzoate 4-monooxygenase cytochrome P450 [Colletotrichum higginsianum IMI 349063]OBR08000.1 Benzoate 4-monooxygenase cytochrome P450 [Colletotrichum higginsianum IMI 349063]CCF34289.1 benzoate 4-monooxygenase cytochrome P450 [Colletotrichum higginsianum]